MIKILTIILLAFSLASCFSSNPEKQKSTNILGKKNIQYYSNKTVSSLKIPPDLTKPNSENAFKISEYVQDVKEDIVDFSNNESKNNVANILQNTNVKLKRLGQIRWIIVDKKPDEVWNLAKSFFKSHGFAIKKADKNIGVMETDFLENRQEIPDESVGFIRSMLKKAFKARYALPTIDKYRVRIEPADNDKTEVYFTLKSMKEVITDAGGDTENTIWQVRDKDELLETEMLYRFMVYLGSDRAKAKVQITKSQDEKKTNVKLLDGVGGYSKLQFSLSRYETWEYVGWALDQMDIDIGDKDIKEGSFYINVAKDKDKGILSRIFGKDAIKKSYQIIVKQISSNSTDVYFNDLTDKNEQTTIDFSRKLLGDIAGQFK
ncbi:MAG: outer membrane protein assembly factor BamC [Candidatus Thioglobus sp.]|nr:MAG: outer membrane protein assembly factor BamC [Candidatus Thioglobus sp.]KAA0454957.1 MAG: outer membrane protein assembly factor BamC [Candidatus Thioglobus sp.]